MVKRLQWAFQLNSAPSASETGRKVIVTGKDEPKLYLVSVPAADFCSCYCNFHLQHCQDQAFSAHCGNGIYFDNYTIHLNTLCGKNAVLNTCSSYSYHKALCGYSRLSRG